jgi:hypothetical protein
MRMLARLLCVMLITGCFEAKKPAERPRYAVYNALTLVGGLALGGFGVALAVDQDSSDSDGVGGFTGVMMATGGGLMVIGGLGGLLEALLCSAPCR